MQLQSQQQREEREAQMQRKCEQFQFELQKPESKHQGTVDPRNSTCHHVEAATETIKDQN